MTSVPQSLALPPEEPPPTGPRCLVFKGNSQPQHLTNLSTISDVLDDSQLVWLDVVAPSAADVATLREEFGLHPLALEDATSHHELPKIEAYDRYWFLVVHGITRQDERLTVHEISAFAGKNFVVTVRDSPAYPLSGIEARWRAEDTSAHHTSTTLLYYLLDAVVDGYTAVSDITTERIERFEDRLFGDTRRSDGVFREIYRMKKDAQHFRRSVAPLREMLNTLIRTDSPTIAENERFYFRDVYDHTVRVLEQLDGARDLLTSALDIHFSVNAQQQNEVAKQLTVIATIFLPLTYITGFFGQNFGFLVNHIVTAGSFWWLGIGTEVVSIVALFLWFRLRGWV